MADYVAYWRQRRADEQADLARLRAQVHADARSVAELLRARYGVTRVLLFGSLLTDRFAADSDIDLAVEGLPRAALFAAMGEASALVHRWVDIKPLEELSEHFLRRVLSTGEEL